MGKKSKPEEFKEEKEEVIKEEEEIKRKKKEKKDKKKKRKAAEVEGEEEEVAVEEVGGERSDEVIEKKSKKKDKKDRNDRKEEELVFDRYVPHEEVNAMSEEEAAAFRLNLGMTVYPEEAMALYKPLSSFSHLLPTLNRHCAQVMDYIRAKAFKTPSPIQSQCWPPLLDGKDVIGIAATGSGKTMAFLVPALLKLATTPKSPKMNNIPSPRVLVVAPTRELAMQSYQVFADVGGHKSVCIYGGVGKGDQIRELKQGAEVVVATPGRLIDLMHDNLLSLQEIIYLVLDEADRMLDDGFEPAISEIVRSCPSKSTRQTVMFSATWPEEIRVLAEKYLKPDTVRVCVGSEELSANHRVTQIVECIESFAKDKRLVTLLQDYHKSRKNRILIFVLYKKEAVTLQNTLQSKGFHVTAIHGDKGQNERTAALEEFKSGRTPLLIATDVAARGLDIPQVEYVINYSFPLTVEDYVHRIGRTGRGGASGISHTFFTDFDKGLAGALVAVLQEAKQEVPKEIYQYPLITKKKTSKMYGDFGPKSELAGKKATKITFDD